MYTKLTITKSIDGLHSPSYSDLFIEAEAFLNSLLAENKTDGVLEYVYLQDNSNNIECKRKWVDQQAAQEWLDGIGAIHRKYNAYFEIVEIQDI
jgi:hypothetical protein